MLRTFQALWCTTGHELASRRALGTLLTCRYDYGCRLSRDSSRLELLDGARKRQLKHRT